MVTSSEKERSGKGIFPVKILAQMKLDFQILKLRSLCGPVLFPPDPT